MVLCLKKEQVRTRSEWRLYGVLETDTPFKRPGTRRFAPARAVPDNLLQGCAKNAAQSEGVVREAAHSCLPLALSNGG
jgi:hypothetical protein